MTTEDLEFAIGDAQRFIDRAKLIKSKATDGQIPEADAKTVTRLSLDVTRALQDLRREPRMPR